MALVTVNGIGVIGATICMPRIGAWTADLRVDSPDELPDAITISIADGLLVLRGTAERRGVFVDAASIRAVAGAGQLSKPARPRHYTSSNVRIVLGDLLREATETLSSTASTDTLRRSLEAWTTQKVATGRCVATLLAAAAPGAGWRMLPDGTMWVGVETWPDSGIDPGDYQVMDEHPDQAMAYLGVEAPILLPGTTLAERRVSRVEHRIRESGVRTVVWYEQ